MIDIERIAERIVCETIPTDDLTLSITARELRRIILDVLRDEIGRPKPAPDQPLFPWFTYNR